MTKYPLGSGLADIAPTILLDIDGTLIDSYASISTGFLNALASVGAPHPGADFMTRLAGPPIEESFQKAGLAGAQLELAMTNYYEFQQQGGYLEVRAFAGMLDLLKLWKQRGWRLATASSKSISGAKLSLEYLGMLEYIDFLGAASDAPDYSRRGKISVLDYVFQKLALDPTQQRIVLVGDRIHDIDGAKHFGIPAIGVNWGYGSVAEFSQAAAVVDTPAELDIALSKLVSTQL
ncbi:HAD hydrolase-like protein [Corynebacterium caspium]|uniref:HAD hydrolase-like protein n=1 Tax=Corynebacterium caspium TaxID=234828 RepID=UPI0003A449CC|nr:HAD hydrolase-like protein [Corynebacterium caspium]WKD59668.1 5'-nucleotidase [Corynebacterium caspium DSM 44850]